jgi:hypothetical protein
MRTAPFRVLARRGALILAAALAATPAAACGSAGDAQQILDRARLVNDLADRLTKANELTYTADYLLSDGGTATIAQAQQPRRVAVRYPGGAFLVTPGRVADCRTAGAATTCTLTAPPSPSSDALQVTIRDSALIAPAQVVGLLTAASLSSNTVVDEHDTTIGGEHATCVAVTGVENATASAFTACITAAGVLGSFSGTVGGTRLDVSLTRLQDTIAADAFELPTGAKIVDHRPPG